MACIAQNGAMKYNEPLVNEKNLRQTIPISRRELGRWVKEGCPSVRKRRRRFFQISAVFGWLRMKGYFEGDWID